MTLYKKTDTVIPNIKLMAINMDGTLMDSSDHIPETTIKRIRKLSEQGILMVPCSGRYLKSIPQNLLMAGNVRYAITANGAQIWRLHPLSSLYRAKLPDRTVKTVLEFLKGREGYGELFSQGKSYINEGDCIRASRMKQDYNFVQYFTRNHTLVPDLSKAADLWNETEKINLFFLEAGDRKELEGILRKQGGVRLTSSMAGNMEINDGSAHKGAALKWLCRYLDIPMEQTLAIGDGDNDVEMIRSAGWGIAMGNSGDELKRLARFVTKDNDHGGVEEVLKWVEG
ncbi:MULTISPECIES: Cof-type HAD-IIB family hydrolase [unclassified Clostridium]|uniref:Cof-type HAD-IIB family hydrolase n=1 Tax=unclassified Clostridium TaxID=2614128 RepID=UPI00110640BE|nr:MULTISPECIES: Cof-type HAD-IIB family hydrolase [unclassified Clostridium]